jgi:hypothetical protein
MEADFAFTPGGTVKITAGTTTGQVALADTLFKLPRQVEIYNSGTVIAFVAFGKAGVTVDAAAPIGYPIPPGATRLVTVPDIGVARYMAAITLSGTADVYATIGDGE